MKIRKMEKFRRNHSHTDRIHPLKHELGVVTVGESKHNETHERADPHVVVESIGQCPRQVPPCKESRS